MLVVVLQSILVELELRFQEVVEIMVEMEGNLQVEEEEVKIDPLPAQVVLVVQV